MRLLIKKRKHFRNLKIDFRVLKKDDLCSATKTETLSF